MVLPPSSASAHGPASILAWPGPTDDRPNSYLREFYGRLTERGWSVADARDLSAARARHAVLHIHWPETFQSLPTGAVAARQLAQLLGLVTWHKARGARLVWTAHNTVPQQLRYPRLQAALERSFFPRVDAVLHLSHVSRTLVADGQGKRLSPSCQHFFVGHGATLRPPKRTDVGGPDVLCIGEWRRYKLFPEFTRALLANVPGVTVRVAGAPTDEAVACELAELAEQFPERLALLARPLTDEEYEHEVSKAGAVFTASQPGNFSGSALHALSLGARVITNRTPVGRELQAAVSGDWLYLLADLSTDQVGAAARWARASDPDGMPDLYEQEWSAVIRRADEALRRVLEVAAA